MNRLIKLRQLSLPVRILFTSYLLTVGAAYLFALVYLFLIDIEPHRDMGMGLLQSTIVKYYGMREDTRLEVAVNGTMGEVLTEKERMDIVAWIKEDATEKGFITIQPIFERTCAGCHSPESGLNLIPLTTYEDVRSITNIDLGESFRTLARVSHIHLFGMSFIFILSGMIFSLSERNKYLRAIIVVLPFVAIWIDIGSWWFTKFQPLFAYTVIIGGALMGIAFSAQILISLYEMWLTVHRQE